MDTLEKKKRALEIARVKLAKDELEYKVSERMEEIKRLQDNIKIQDEKIKELENSL